MALQAPYSVFFEKHLYHDLLQLTVNHDCIPLRSTDGQTWSCGIMKYAALLRITPSRSILSSLTVQKLGTFTTESPGKFLISGSNQTSSLV